jgi:hypothetical protein
MVGVTKPVGGRVRGHSHHRVGHSDHMSPTVSWVHFRPSTRSTIHSPITFADCLSFSVSSYLLGPRLACFVLLELLVFPFPAWGGGCACPSAVEWLWRPLSRHVVHRVGHRRLSRHSFPPFPHPLPFVGGMISIYEVTKAGTALHGRCLYVVAVFSLCRRSFRYCICCLAHLAGVCGSTTVAPPSLGCCLLPPAAGLLQILAADGPALGGVLLQGWKCHCGWVHVAAGPRLTATTDATSHWPGVVRAAAGLNSLRALTFLL